MENVDPKNWIVDVSTTRDSPVEKGANILTFDETPEEIEKLKEIGNVVNVNKTQTSQNT